MTKVAILGAGNVGTATATYLADRNIADEIVLVDVVNYGLAAGKAVDMAAASAVRGFSSKIWGTDKIEEIAGAAVVVNTAGVPRKPGMDRMDLIKTNAAIAKSLAEGVAKHAADAVFIQVANPLDVLCSVVLETTGFPRERVIGMAGVLDTTRFRSFLADAIGCDPQDVSAMVMGGHGDSMVPITRTATVSGVPIATLLTQETIDEITLRTRKAGAEVVGLLKTGSAFTSTGAAINRMIEPCLTGRPRLLPAAVYLDGEYGLSGLYLGAPILLGKGGMQKIVEIELTDAEKTALVSSAEEVKNGMAALV